MKSFQIFARLDYVTFTKDLQCVLIQYLYYTLDWHYWSIQCWFNIWDSFDCFPYHLTLLITALCVSLPYNSCVGSRVMRAWRQLWGARARSEQGWAEWRSEHGQESSGDQWSRRRRQKHVITNQSKQISSLITAGSRPGLAAGGWGSHHPVAVWSPGSRGWGAVTSADIRWD